MPPLDDNIRLLHMIEAAQKAVDYAEGHDRADLDDDEILRLALTKLVEIVGEAAKQVSEQMRSARPEVPWSAAARMRDRLVSTTTSTSTSTSSGPPSRSTSPPS